MEGKIIPTTSANRGIGFAIIHSLASTAPNNTYLLGVRSPSAGAEAISQLREASLQSNLDVVELDITADASISAAVEKVCAQYGRLDVLARRQRLLRAWLARQLDDGEPASHGLGAVLCLEDGAEHADGGEGEVGDGGAVSNCESGAL